MIERFAANGRPFFVHVAYTAPHSPLHARPADIAKHAGKYDEGYTELRRRRHRRQIELGIVDPRWTLPPADPKQGSFTYDYAIEPWETNPDRARETRRMEVLAAMIESMDAGVGRILQSLDRLGIADNTLVLFLSDNGGCAYVPPDRNGFLAYNKDLPGAKNTYDFGSPGWGWAQNTPFRRYKTWTYEGGIATPLIVRWPKVVAGNRIDHQSGHVIDLLPTFAEVAGATYPTTHKRKRILPLEGRSLVPILRGEQRPGDDTLYWEFRGNRAIRQGKWKLVRSASRKTWELYDMEVDRTETLDLAAQDPGRVQQMSEAWEKWAQRVETPNASGI
jgi:arylsulfatase